MSSTGGRVDGKRRSWMYHESPQTCLGSAALVVVGGYAPSIPASADANILLASQIAQHQLSISLVAPPKNS